MMKIRALARLALAALLALAACHGGDDEPRVAGKDAEETDGCRWGTAPDTAGWTVVDAGPIVFKVPPEYRERVVTGVDSYVGIRAAGDRAISFDYGPFTSDPRDRPATGGWSCVTKIGGRDAVVRAGSRVVPGSDGERVRHDVAEAWWRDAGEGNHLLVIGWGPEADSAGHAAALASLRTVRFRTVWTPADSLRQLHRFCGTLRVQAARDTAYRKSLEEWRATCPDPSAAPPPPPDYEAVR